MKFPQKLSTLKNKVHKRTKSPYNHRNSNKFVTCKKNVVYKISCTCGASYIDQMGRCLNHGLLSPWPQRTSFRALTTRSVSRPFQTGKHVPEHLKDCKGEMRFNKAKVLAKRRDRRGREVIEAFYIDNAKNAAFSSASTRLRATELDSVRRTLERTKASRQSHKSADDENRHG
jgi:hypothetical protein